MKRPVILAAAALLGVAAFAQSAPAPASASASPAFLPKAEVQKFTEGKKWTYVRASDRNNVQWDLRSGGTLYGANFTANGNDSGSWAIDDEGQVCVKWRGRSANVCVKLRRDGDKVYRVEPDGSESELTIK